MASYRCVNCGKLFPGPASFGGVKKVETGSWGGDAPIEGYFCSAKCRDEYREREEAAQAAHQQAKAEKKQAKIAEKAQKEAAKERKQAKKEAKKQKALENSKITSDEGLAKTFKLCLVGGYIGVHDFALGKLKPGIIKVVIAIYVIYITIVEKNPSLLMFLLINIAWWGIDLILIKSGKFTDKYGYSIRN